MVSIPVTPCNCVSVDSAAVACLLLCCILHLRRQHSRLKLHQLLFPREQSATMQQAADVVITCDVVKLTLGLIVVHGSLFIHEAIVSNGGVNETKYYFLIHMARAFIDIVLVSVIAHVFWMHALVPYVNHLISRGSVDGRTSVFFSALRASGRYNSTYGLNWENEDSLDLRVDATEAPVPQLRPSVLDQRIQQRRLVEEAANNLQDDEEDDTDDPRAQLRRQVASNPYEPDLIWWKHQTTVWCCLLLVFSLIVVGIQLVWRELLGTNDPMLYALTKFTDAVDGSGDFVCGGEENGELLRAPPTHTIVVLSWIGLLLYHLLLAAGTLVVLHHAQRYKGRTVHAVHSVN